MQAMHVVDTIDNWREIGKMGREEFPRAEPVWIFEHRGLTSAEGVRNAQKVERR